MSTPDRAEVRAVIKFCQELGKTPTETYDMIRATKIKDRVSRTLVFEWHRRFTDGRESLQDNEGRGRKRKHRATLVTSIKDPLANERRLTVRTLAEIFGVGYVTIYRILTEDLQMSKVHARWVPRLLKDHEKDRRVQDSRRFLRRFGREVKQFLSRIITTDDTWLWFYDPEMKSQSAVWKWTGSPPPKKARASKSGGKHMFIMFADINGMILNHAVPNNTTVNAEYYSKVLRRDLLHAPQKKRPGFPLEDFILHMDNASSHTAARTRLEIDVLEFETISHPPYSPDLAPFDYAIFPSIKKQLKGQRFHSLTDIRKETS